MLALSAKDLNSTGHLSAIADVCPTQYAIRTDIYTVSDPGLRMSEEGPELNAAAQGTLIQSKPVVGDPQIVAQDARRHRARLSEHHEDGLQPAKTGQQSGQKSQDQEYRLAQAFQQCLQTSSS